MSIYNKKSSELIEDASNKLKSVIKAPEWSLFVKTGAAKERPPENQDWWYTRAASILKKVYVHGPIGVSKLRTRYGSKKNRGHKPEKFYKSSGKIIRTILQQLEQANLIQKTEKGVHKGRIITNKGKSLLDKNEPGRIKEEKTRTIKTADRGAAK